MNKTKIEWCDSTWNPVVGCLHGCPYCYARKMTTRFGTMQEDRSGYGETHYNAKLHCLETRIDGNPYPYLFEPTFFRYKLDEPRRKKKKETIFVCSMADLFGDWVPDEWIEDVFRAVQSAPQHRYMFLTKNPERYKDLPAPCFNGISEIWFGASITNGDEIGRVSYLLEAVAKYKRVNIFASVEPLLENLEQPDNLKYLDWVIIGAETGNRAGKVVPEKAWVENIVHVSKSLYTPVFMKESLRGIMGEDFWQEFPWK